MVTSKSNLSISKLLLIISLTAFSWVSLANSMTVEHFSKRSEFFNVKISPDGKHLAVLANDKGKKNIIFFKADTLELVSAVVANRDSQPANFYWANNERVVVQVEQMRGGLLETPLSFGEIFAVDYDGKRRKMLYGYRSKKGAAVSADGGFLLDLLEDDPKHVLITHRPLSRRTDVTPKVVKLNIYSGRTTTVKIAPGPYSRLLVDNNGVTRFASKVDDDFNAQLFYTEGRGKEWQSFDELLDGDFTPVSFSADNKAVYGLYEDDGKPSQLVKLDIKSQKQELIHASKRVDVTQLLRSGLNEVYGVRLDEDYPSYVYLDDNSRNAQLHRALFQAFNYQTLEITSQTSDGKKLIVFVTGDTNPGIFYLFDTEKMATTPLFQSANWIDSKQLAKTEPIRLQSKDGLEINGYMTIPKGKSKNLPMVVVPHGGPHVRDYWEYNSTVQMLANEGFVVVQVNFRGSTGYGDDFMEAGYSQWGAAIQQDIQLAAQYVIDSGIADKDRVCIYGGSFGGYSALQSSVLYPDLYKCAIGFVGVYDLPMLYNEGDVKNNRWGDAYLDTTLGTDIEEQKKQSPTYNLDKLKAPVLIIHGAEDQRAHIAHAEKLREGLDEINHPYEWLVKEKEGHGFYNEENVLEANKKILTFLNKYIGD